MANTTNTQHTCKECGHCHMGLCTKSNQAVHATQYACHRFQTLTQIKEEREARLQARLRKEEERLNFILTALYISTTASMQLLEYFDAQFQDRKAESNWRFARKRAANEIDRAVQRIRDIYQHSFMVDQTQVMTKHGKEAFDVEAYDNHEDDARRWNLCLFHHMDGCWQDEAQEARVLKFYEDQPHIGIFEPKDFRHFAKRQ